MEQQTQTSQAPSVGTTSNIVLQDGTQLDPKVVKVMRGLRQVESGGDYNAVGDNGNSKGAYQFHNDNWKVWAKQYLGDENAPMTPANQNKLMYNRIKEQKDAGLSPDEIAAIHNGAKKDPMTGKYSYINPEYGVKFKQALMGQGDQSTPTQQNGNSGYAPPTPPPSPTFESDQGQSNTGDGQNKGFLSEAGSDISNALGGAGTALSDVASGKINLVSGILQGVGSLAGGVGSLANTAATHIPVVGKGVQGIENLIGKGVGALANTSVGKPIMSAIESFTKSHPELAGDIGAGVNIATAIPIFEGLSAAKNVALGAVGTALKDTAEKGVINDMTEAFAKTKTLSKTFAKNGGPDTISNAVKTLGKDAVPSIEGGKYATQEAFGTVGDQISKVDDELDAVLNKGNVPQISARIPLEQYKQVAIQDAVDQLKDTGPIEKYFDRLKLKYGDYPTAQQMNEAKRIVAKNITDNGFHSATYDTDKVVRSSLQQAVEDWGNATNNPEINAINKRMGNLIKYQNMLKAIDTTPVKIGAVRKGLQQVVGATAGGLIGRATGGGTMGELIGGFGGEKLSGSLLGKKNVGGIVGRLLK